MARIRTIKPEFFTDDVLAQLGPIARLFFIGLWTEADAEGRLEDRPLRLKARLLPYDNADPAILLGELEAAGFIRRYQVDGRKYIQVRTFARHQRVPTQERKDYAEAAAGGRVIPPPPPPCVAAQSALTNKVVPEYVPTDDLDRLDRDQEGKGREGKGRDKIPPSPLGGGQESFALTGIESAGAPETASGAEDPEAQLRRRNATVFHEDFETWYGQYPKKLAKLDAAKAWGQTAKLRPPLPQMLAKLREQCDSHDWRKDGGKWIPYPASYLRAGQWSDEVRIDARAGPTQNVRVGHVRVEAGTKHPVGEVKL